MARLKRGSTVLDKATRRIAGMRSISETLEFADSLNLTEYQRRIQTLQTKLSSYNTMLSTLDEAMGQIQLLEEDLSSYSEKMLMSVGTRYGKNSLQYVQAGGKRRQRNKGASNTEPATTAIAPNVEKATTNGKSTETAVH
ncbi:hypothetical protein A6769_08610 [Nostoc punctiforme NIES-2108]|uniref:ATPase involved in DNA repair n=1 Tax=Nostoc punctiforme NIES-2108 TaxID=1356359 RepID=A0A367RRW5_NOSPU|nr:hypothetical protein A6769_08610 [Nostoc punctiforme NIES-2108]